MATIGDFTAETANGTTRSLSEYAGKVCLVVNMANTNGHAEQSAALEELWRRHRDRGFVVLGFPCPQLVRSDSAPGEDAGFSVTESGITFPVFAEVSVNGPAAHPLWAWLRRSEPGRFGDRITWNFTQFLVGRDGRVVARYSPRITTDVLAQNVVEALMTR